MRPVLRVLIVEDNETDAALLVRELSRDYEVAFERVQTQATMQLALEKQTWDVVISDYSMPQFSAPAALALVQKKGLNLPFIIVSGTVDEVTALQSVRFGAHDFLPKGKLVRLLPAIARELREAVNRAEGKKLHEQTLIADRMVSVGTLAAGVAHEINNPLMVLLANLDIVAETLSKPDANCILRQGSAEPADRHSGPAARLAEVAEPLRFAQAAAERVRLIVQDLKLLSRAGDEERHGPVDIHAVLETSIRMAVHEIRHRARLTKDFGNVPQVEGNEVRLGQVFLNLIVNAAQAIPEGRADANEIKILTRVDGAGSVVVEVHDSGMGIAPDVLPRIFDPFFTTKPIGIGTGLGLAICHRIIGTLGGEISVESKVGKGTVFRTILPRAFSAVAVMESASPAAAAGRRCRIMVVDDEPMLCMTIEQMLRRDHDVTAVTEAQEACRLIANGERYDCILCDLMMPQMTGMDLHAELLAIAPQQANNLAFMTGGVFTQNARTYVGKVANKIIEKPFTGAALRNFVRSMCP